MPDEKQTLYRRIGLWVNSQEASKIVAFAVNRLFGPGLLCSSIQIDRVGTRFHLKAGISVRETWDVRARLKDGSTLSVSVPDYAPQGLMPVRFYQRLHRPLRRTF